MAFDNIVDAKRVLWVLSKRLAQYEPPPSIPTRRTSSTSAQRDHRSRAIRRRIEPPLTSSA